MARKPQTETTLAPRRFPLPADLRGADLSGVNLSGVHLRGRDLSRANLSGADLRGANARARRSGRKGPTLRDVRGTSASGLVRHWNGRDRLPFYLPPG